MNRYSIGIDFVDYGITKILYEKDNDGEWIKYEDYESERSAMCEADSNAVLYEVNGRLNRRIKMTEEMKNLKEACVPLLKLLNDANHHPHMTVIVTATSIELVEGVCSIPEIYEFVND